MELFGPEWDEIDFNEDVVQGSDASFELENCTSEYAYVIKISVQSTHSTYDLYIQAQPQSFLFEFSDIGFEQEDAPLASQSSTTNQVSPAADFHNNGMSHVNRNINTQDSEELVSKNDSVVSPFSPPGESFFIDGVCMMFEKRGLITFF